VNISTLLIGSTARRPEHPPFVSLNEESPMKIKQAGGSLVPWTRSCRTPSQRCVCVDDAQLYRLGYRFYALAKVGAVVLPVNFLYRVGELEHISRTPAHGPSSDTKTTWNTPPVRRTSPRWICASPKAYRLARDSSPRGTLR